jgi:hypothetical protein
MFSTSFQNFLEKGVKLLLNILIEAITVFYVSFLEGFGKDQAWSLVRDGGSLGIGDRIALK